MGSPRTGRKHNANNQNKTNTSTQNKQGKGKKMPNAVKKTKTVGRPKKSHCKENKMVQHTAEKDINANNTGIKPINASSKKNETKTMTRQEKRRCTENKNEPCTSTNKIKKLKLLRFTDTFNISEDEEVDNFEGFNEINATNNKNFILPKVEYLNNAKKYAENGFIGPLPEISDLENHSIQEVDVDDEIENTANGEDHLDLLEILPNSDEISAED